MRRYIAFIIFWSIAFYSDGQIIINEVSSASYGAYKDEDGEQEDWIEFYNAGSVAVNLLNYSINRYEKGKKKTWKFPDIIVKPNEYLTVFLSGKNRKQYFDHWEIPVSAENTWKYLCPRREPSAEWRTPEFNDSRWLIGPGGIGFGDNDDSTVIDRCNSVYMRRTFNVLDPSRIILAVLQYKYDDAFVAYLNNVEIARSNIGTPGDHPGYKDKADSEHEAVFSDTFLIEQELIDSAIIQGKNVLAIQVHNYVSGMDDMTSMPYFIMGVNDTVATYTSFPAKVFLHTDFDLSSEGQIISFMDPEGAILEMDTIDLMKMNHSRGRFSNGAPAKCLFDRPTPDTSNYINTCFIGYGGDVKLSLPAGYYRGSQTVSIKGPSRGIIRYTTDGSLPVSTSAVYSVPVVIKRNTVLRARFFPFVSTLRLPGNTTSATYFINETSSFPVISLSTDPYNLFDYSYGIYEFGPNADSSIIPYFGSNFWMDWERPANIEYFDANAGPRRFSINAGIKIQGHFSMAWPQKGFSIKAKNNYGGVPMSYSMFPDKPHLKTFKSFNIRNAGSDWNTCHFRDRLIQKTVQKKTHLDVMDGRPCLLFINGKYFGVYELREKLDLHYIEHNFGVNSDEIDFLELDGDIIAGNNKGFHNMVRWIECNDMSFAPNYDSVKVMIDMQNFTDYFITETFINNVDWLGPWTNNIKFWRPATATGKWRYMLWDTDLSLGIAPQWGGADTTNMLSIAINPAVVNPHSKMLRALLVNKAFRNYFVNRYADLMNTIFHVSNFSAMAKQFHDEMLPEMARHFGLWGGTLPAQEPIAAAYDVPSWESQIDRLIAFMAARPFYARNHLASEFNLAGQVDVTLATEPENAGSIVINTILPDSLPWKGVYFKGVPITVTAIEKPGFRFRYWKSDVAGNTPVYNKTLTINMSTSDRLTAVYEASDFSLSVFPGHVNKKTDAINTLINTVKNKK